MRWWALVGAVALAGCADPIGDAKTRLAIAERNGDKDEICRRYRELADAYMQAKDEQGYRNTAPLARLRCL